jgi:ADP-heptose:LPS heptosyltransferase
LKRVLIIQTAFIGDVILATSLIETIAATFGHTWQIDVLVRKGNEPLLQGNPHVHQVLVWNKKNKKYSNLFNLLVQIRSTKYEAVYNLQRYAASGLLTWLSQAKLKGGFDKNPFSFSFTRKVTHKIGDGSHEIDRNFQLIAPDVLGFHEKSLKPKLYPSESDFDRVNELIKERSTYLVFAPASVWFTKQLPFEKWVELGRKMKVENRPVFFIGAPSDVDFIDDIISTIGNDSGLFVNVAGKLSLLESAVLIKKAKRTFVNDSAPLHLASAMDAPVTAFFCSTIPAFGFGPLSADHQLIEVTEKLSCRPCGVHGFKTCPQGHFKCGIDIQLNNLIY